MGASAVRGKKGILDQTQLFRAKPFGEWVTVYYDPKMVSEKVILGLLKANRCPNATLIRNQDGVSNPYVAGGDIVQFTVGKGVKATELPEGWEILKSREDGFDIKIPKKAKQQDYVIKGTDKSGAAFEGKVTVVRQIGKS